MISARARKKQTWRRKAGQFPANIAVAETTPQHPRMCSQVSRSIPIQGKRLFPLLRGLMWPFSSN